jgi:hypothetical protein
MALFEPELPIFDHLVLTFGLGRDRPGICSPLALVPVVALFLELDEFGQDLVYEVDVIGNTTQIFVSDEGL